MRRRPVVTILMLVILILPLPLRAQRKNVAPTFRSACADVAASLPRHGGVKPPLRHADLKVSATKATRAGADPFFKVCGFSPSAAGLQIRRYACLGLPALRNSITQ